jgi:hypothetical protein
MSEVKVDWKATLAGLWTQLIARSGTARTEQPNICDFEAPSPSQG